MAFYHMALALKIDNDFFQKFLLFYKYKRVAMTSGFNVVFAHLKQ